MIYTTNDSLKIGALTMIAGLRIPGRVTGIAKDGRTIKYSVRYIVDGKFREAFFGREQLTMIARPGGKDV